jgi:hypothetical protein
MAAYGSPEMAQVQAATEAETRRTQAAGAVMGAKTEADVDKAVKALPPDPLTGKPNPEMVNAVWNTRKAQHGDKAAQAALAPPTPTPTPTPTEGTAATGGVAQATAALAGGGTAQEGVGWRSTC